MTTNNITEIEEINKERLKEDIGTIKSLLMDVDEKAILPYWAYYIWGSLFCAGAVIHYFSVIKYNVHTLSLLKNLWVPILIIGTVFEIMGFRKKMLEESLPCFSRAIIKLNICTYGSLICIVFASYMYYKAVGFNNLPVFLQFQAAILLFFYAQVSYFNDFLYIGLIIIAAIIIYFIPSTLEMQFLLSGMTVGVSVMLAGYINWKNEKKNDDK
jgi:hypothetical protein